MNVVEVLGGTQSQRKYAESMVQFIMAPSPNGIGNNSGGLDKVSFIFSYAPTVSPIGSPPGQNSPMFGEGGINANTFWT